MNTKWVGALVGLLLGGAALDQSSGSSVGSILDIDGAFVREQQNLANETSAFLTGGVTVEEFQSWNDQHLVELQNQQRSAEALGAACVVQPFLIVGTGPVEIGSIDLNRLTQGQSSLANAYAGAHNQQVQVSTNVLSPGLAQTTIDQIGVDQIPLSADKAFQSQNAAQIQAQQQNAQSVAAEASQVALPMPPPLVLPVAATPAQASMLTLRDQLMREEILEMNEYSSASPSVRKAMMDQWHQQNAGRFQQLQEMLKNLAP